MNRPHTTPPGRDIPPDEAPTVSRRIPQDAPLRRTERPSPADPAGPTDGIPDGYTDSNTVQEGPGDPDAVGPEPIDKEPIGTYPMTGEGKLLFQITTARGAIPLEGALVTVRDHDKAGPSPAGDGPEDGPDGHDTDSERAEGGVSRPVPPGGRVTRAVMISGPDGKTPILSLPTPDKALSMTSTGQNAPLPYARYDAEVLLDGYYVQEYTRIPLFDGITSVQRVDLIPLPIGGTGEEIPDETFVNEGQNPDL